MSDVPPLSGDWQSKMAVPHCFWHMFEKQVACDVVFEVGADGERIGAHMVILMSRSSRFFELFSSGAPEKEVEESSTSPDVFRTFLRYLYTGLVDLVEADLDDLQALAEKYNVGGLLDRCLVSHFEMMKSEAFSSFLRKYERFLTGYIEFKALEFTFANTKAVFSASTFIEMPRSFLSILLSHERLELDEEDLCTAVLLWASRACQDEGLEVTGENQRNVLGDLLYAIRFPIVSQDYFTENISESGLLSATEEMQLLKHFLSPNKPVSANFKFILSKRCPPESLFIFNAGNGIPNEMPMMKRLKTADMSLENGSLATVYQPSLSLAATPAPVAAGDSLLSSPTVQPSPTVQQATPPVQSPTETFTGTATVTRFTTEGTGWGYRGNKKDAIAFCTSKSVTLQGFLIYGNCKVSGKMQVAVSVQHGQTEVALVSTELDTDVSKPLYEVMLDSGVAIEMNTDYHVILSVKGDTGFYGKGGQATVTCKGVDFTFKRSKFSTNNTTPTIGQIAGFKFSM